MNGGDAIYINMEIDSGKTNSLNATKKRDTKCDKSNLFNLRSLVCSSGSILTSRKEQAIGKIHIIFINIGIVKLFSVVINRCSYVVSTTDPSEPVAIIVDIPPVTTSITTSWTGSSTVTSTVTPADSSEPATVIIDVPPVTTTFTTSWTGTDISTTTAFSSDTGTVIVKLQHYRLDTPSSFCFLEFFDPHIFFSEFNRLTF